MITESPQTTRSGLSWTVIVIPLLVLSLAIRVAAVRHWGIGPIETKAPSTREWQKSAQPASARRNRLAWQGAPFNPLYPVLISGVSFLTNDCERAARLISLFTEPCFLWWRSELAPVFWPLRGDYRGASDRNISATGELVLYRLFGGKLRHRPFLCVLPGSSRFKARFVAQLVAGRSRFRPSLSPPAESTAPLLIAALFAFAMPADKPALRYKRAAAAICGYLVLALPQVIVLYRSTGKLLFEGKIPSSMR